MRNAPAVFLAVALLVLAWAIGYNARSTRMLSAEIRVLQGRADTLCTVRAHYKDSVGKWYPAVLTIPKRE